MALVPASIPPLIKSGPRVQIEAKAGLAAGFNGDAYADAGAEIVDDRRANHPLGRCPAASSRPGRKSARRRRRLEVHARRPGDHRARAIRSEIRSREATGRARRHALRHGADSADHPRQSMDVLSSMATIAGYKAVLLAADRLPKMFPLMMTAAGTLTPAKVFVIGAGVAGLQAIATSRRLGAVVHALRRPPRRERTGRKPRRDVRRSAARNHRRRSRRRLRQTAWRRVLSEAARADGPHRRRQRRVHHTAAIPGKPSPRIITADAVEGMAPGSVIVDLAAERGGNCELTKADRN